MSTATVKKRDLQTLHSIITLALMFGVGFLPPVSQLTPSGMKIVGILLGTIYGCSFCAPAWPCLMAMGALVITGVASFNTVISTGVGNDGVWLMIFFFVFVAILEQNKITEAMATWLISRKIVSGRPWLYSYFLIIGTMFTGAFGSSFPAMIVFWSILITTCRKFDIAPYSKYPTVMFIGICIGGLASSSTWLFRGNPLFVNTSLKAISEGAYAFNFGLYAFFSFIMWMIVIAGYILMGKYLLKIDVSVLAEIDDSIVDKTAMRLDKRQRVVALYTVLILIVYCTIGFVPAASAAGQYLATFGTAIPIAIILGLMCITRIGGEPICQFGQAARQGMVWDTIILSAGLLSISTIMMTTDTGVSQTILSVLGPVFNGRGTIFMCIFIVVLSVILTNFMANTTVGLMFTPVIYSFSVSMGFNPMPIMAMMLVSIHIAYLTPAASPFASLLFGYSSWVKPTDIYKYGGIAVIGMIIIFLAVGIPLSSILF